MRSFLSTLILIGLLTGCYNARHATVALRGNPDGADCFVRCSAAPDGPQRTACVAACPRASQGGGVCPAGDEALACAQTRKLSRWKTAGLVVLGVVTVGLVTQ